MDKKKLVIIGAVVALVVVLLIAVSVSNGGQTTSDLNPQSSNTELTPTDFDTLHESSYAPEGFDQIDRGSSKADVDSALGEPTNFVGVSSNGYDAYNYDDGEVITTIYYENDKVVEASFVLK